MKLKIAWIGKTKESAIQSLTDDYIKRLSHYADTEALVLKDEAALLRLCSKAERSSARNTLVLLDSQGQQLSSEEFAASIGKYQTANPLPLLFAIGPPNGFSAATHDISTLSVSLSKMTLPHELARVVLLEQLYRAFTILKGHPYHLGH